MIQRALLAGVAAVGLSAVAVSAASQSAHAADIPRAAPAPYYKAEPAPVRAYNWTGFYAGINGGYGWGRSNWSSTGTADPEGWMLGGTVGYNWQGVASPLVFGLEGDLAWANIRGNFSNAACPFGCETRTSWLGTVRGRVGYAMDRIMPYVTGGLAVGEVKADRAGIGSSSDTKAGWTLGGGVETAFAPAWTAKLEYLYVDLGRISNFGSDVDSKSHVLRAGLNYRF